MKNTRIGLLLLSLFIFQILESKPQNNKQSKTKAVKATRPAKYAAPIKPLKEEIKISEAPLNEFNNANSVENDIIRDEKNDTVTQKKTTMTVEGDKVISTTKSSTWSTADYVKLFGAIGVGTAAVGLGLAYNYNESFANQVDQYGVQAKELGKNAYEGAMSKAGGIKTSFNNWRNGSQAVAAEQQADQTADMNSATAMPMENIVAPAPVSPQAQEEVIEKVADAAANNVEELRAAGAPAEQIEQAEQVADKTAEIQEKVESGAWSLDRATAEFNKLKTEYPNAVLGGEIVSAIGLLTLAAKGGRGQAVWNAIKNTGNKIGTRGAAAEENMMSTNGNLLKDLAVQDAALGGEQAAVQTSKVWATPQGSLMNNGTRNYAQERAFGEAEATIAARERRAPLAYEEVSSKTPSMWSHKIQGGSLTGFHQQPSPRLTAEESLAASF